jgi:hypothetical protein
MSTQISGAESQKVDRLTRLLVNQFDSLVHGHDSDVLGFDDPVVGAAVISELKMLVDKTGEEPNAAQRPTKETLRLALMSDRHAREVLLGLLAPPPQAVEEQARRSTTLARAGRATLMWLRRQAAAAWLNLLVVVSIAGAAGLWHLSRHTPDSAPSGAWESRGLRIFAVWVLAFLPGWMFMRFIGQRAGGLWDEFVINLHRLGVDRPGNLPRPPSTSQFYASWEADEGRERSRFRNIYQQKFDSYYGKSVSRAAVDPDARVKAEVLFPVFLLTAILAVGWTAALWHPQVFDPPADQPLDLRGSLAFAFLGAYSFVVQMLIRRFFQSDLRTSAYASAVLRILTVLVLIIVLRWLPWVANDHSPNQQALVAFLIGFFPVVGLQAIQRVASGVLRVAVPSVRSTHPLSELDGLNVWYEARLLEEGIEDLQNLATANLVDVILHTKVPVGRLVDWVDQSLLLLHLEPPDQSFTVNGQERRERKKKTAAAALRRYGIRTATDLLSAYPLEPTETTPSGERSVNDANRPAGIEDGQLRTILRVLAQEPGLLFINHWWRNTPDGEPG